MVAVSELKNKLKAVSSDIVKLEIDSIFLIENGSSQRIRDDLQAWKLRKEDFAKEFYDNLVSLFSDCYEALDSLQRFVTLDMDTRFDALSTILANPVNVIKNDDVPREPRGVIDRIDESVVKKKVFVDTIVKSKALMGEIKQELERSTKTTVVDFLQVTEYMRYFPYEWMSMNELRLRTIETAILVSKLMVHFISYLPLHDELFSLLKSKIESIKNIPTMRCVMAEKFAGLIEIAGGTMSQMKLKETMFESTKEEQELYNQTITHFYNAVIDLEWIMSFLNVPEKRSLVNGARIRLEGVVGFVLYSMQGVRMKIRKQHRDFWMKMKDVICELWMDLEILPRKCQEREERGGGKRRGRGEAGTSGVKQEAEEAKEEKEEEEEISVRIRRSRLFKIEEEEEEDKVEAGASGNKDEEEDAAESSRKQGEEAGDFSVEKNEADTSGKQVEEAGDCSIKKNEEDVDSSGKQIEEVGDNSINNNEEEDVDSSGKQNEEAGDNPINNEEEEEEEDIDSSRKQVEEAEDDEEEESDSSGMQVEDLGLSYVNIDEEEDSDSSRKQVEEEWDSSVWQFGDKSRESWRKQEIGPLVLQQAGTYVNHEFTLKEDILNKSDTASSDNDELCFSMVSPPQPPVRVRSALLVSDAMDDRDYLKSSFVSSNNVFEYHRLDLAEER